MNLLKQVWANIKTNAVDYYTTLVLVFFIPVVVAYMVNIEVGILLSLSVQALIGMFMLKVSK